MVGLEDGYTKPATIVKTLSLTLNRKQLPVYEFKLTRTTI